MQERPSMSHIYSFEIYNQNQITKVKQIKDLRRSACSLLTNAAVRNHFIYQKTRMQLARTSPLNFYNQHHKYLKLKHTRHLKCS